MQIIIHFSSDLGPWILDSLNQGSTPALLMQTMQEQRMAPEVAAAIVTAFVTAHRSSGPMPVDSIMMDDSMPAYLYETPIFRAGTSFNLNGCTVRIACRAERPTLALLNDVLNEDECKELIALARDRLIPSTVVDPYTGVNVVAEHRSSHGMFFRLQENSFISELDRRISDIMNMPVEHGEGIQVLRYTVGAQSAPHFDFLVPSNPMNRASLARSGQRVSTMVMYLNDVESGGETIFPAIGWSVSPQRGSAVYFEYCNSLGQLDHATLHAGNPIVKGEKWVATKWMRQRPFVPEEP